MILPAHLSTMVLHQLSMPASEHNFEHASYQNNHGHINNYQATLDRSNLSLMQRVGSAVSSQQIANGLQRNLSIRDLNSVSKKNSSLDADKANFLSGLGINNSKNFRENNDNDGNAELETMCQLELDVVDRVIDTALAIKKEALFNRFMVAMLYQKEIIQKKACKSIVSITKRMMIVAPLDSVKDSSSIDAPAHTTFVIESIVNRFDSLSQPSIINLPAQLVGGFYHLSRDWVAVKLSKMFSLDECSTAPAPESVFRICANGFKAELLGNAVIVGSVPKFNQPHTEVSLHIPGAKKIWLEERLPVFKKPLLKHTCSSY